MEVEPLHLSSAVEMPWVLPVAVSGPLEFTLLAVWAQSKPSPYTAQTHRVVAETRPPLLSGPVVLAGDFNAPGHAASHHLTPHLATVDLLDDAGLVSAFAAARGVAHSDLYRDGPDTRPCPALQEPTYYHWRRRDLPWHIDHVFVRRDWTDGIATSVGSYDDWVATGQIAPRPGRGRPAGALTEPPDALRHTGARTAPTRTWVTDGCPDVRSDPPPP